MPPEIIGQAAALGTALFWSATSILFTNAGRRVGSTTVNRSRLILALIFVIVAHLVLERTLVPLEAEPFRWGWLGLSGLIGYVIGDALLFQSFVMVGPRLSMLVMSTNPVFSILLAWIILGETLAGREALGIALVLGGVFTVVLARDPDATRAADLDEISMREYLIGILFALGGSVGQAVGAFFSKLGLVGEFPPISGNLIRLIAAAAVLWVITVVTGQVKMTITNLREHPSALRFLIAGAIAGPFIGVTLSLVAIQNAPLGIATTLMSLTPVLLIPISRVLYKERIGPLAISGTLIAFAGTAVLFL